MSDLKDKDKYLQFSTASYGKPSSDSHGQSNRRGDETEV